MKKIGSLMNGGLLAAVCVSVLAGCASAPPAAQQPQPPRRIDVLVPPPPPPISVIAGNAWSDGMQAMKDQAQQSALTTGIGEVIQTTDNRVVIRVSADNAFEGSTDKLKPRFRAFLDEISVPISQYSYLFAEITAHTDDKGTPANSMRLSDSRAQSTMERLLGKGITRKQMMAEGRGWDEPLVQNDSNESRAKNRRVEISVADPGH